MLPFVMLVCTEEYMISLQFLWEAIQILKIFKENCHVLKMCPIFPFSTGKDTLMGHKFIPFQHGRLSYLQNPEREDMNRAWHRMRAYWRAWIINVQGSVPTQKHFVVIFMSWNTNLPDFANQSILTLKAKFWALKPCLTEKSFSLFHMGF